MNVVATEPQEAARVESDSRALETNRSMYAESGLDVALTNVDRIQRSLLRAAQMLREEDSLKASHFFIHCVDGLENFLQTVVITRCALKLDFNRIEVDGLPLSRVEKDFTSILSSIVTSQAKQDFNGMADIVEYELLTNLSSWGRALRQVQLSRQSNA